MHIKTPQSALLTNHEVLLHLLAEEAEYTGTDSTNRKRKKPSGLTHVLRDGLAYLQTPDYTTTALADAHPNRPMTLYKGPNSLFRALAPKYRLNKAEYLQIYNLRPTTQVMLELVVEEAGTRFTEDELHDMLAIIQQVFDEEEAQIPQGVEHVDMPKIANKLLGAANKKKRKAKRKV
ncbi:hypothetical protein COCC4DRAFT_166871 [Bipolaris maydis ATCC 48331]|uniref:DNA-directed RNA polymerase III subunit RPC9 n=2 Tax=Cochliobolus heterostrophus TaxID=5016 RepID=M2UF04_COCH5|nr:uncharacterized protein COCC4DRAFT_166871 [Bipolaris maydis ATCC 48331]EMD85072.1 hypothetical protein COCHEDRAFT_1149593 [Bipolaris maydis C5]KAJ5029881.1 RNA polymerase Rpb4-domain-containing protein [Bipolaris maydis]EMD86467.1 hypothetical protein COCHEDRAFT_1228473 [Bipolaris maydis C5]ENI06416.1 hypothetical protein COCC4DRAFT_166871 [Bipolaris maydis ATCC 48331]KAJ5064884.1 RNA polymerase Rpb4-domain-containing protein [Bipolaris maydis]